MSTIEWTQHPGGLRSRPLPDVLPIIDRNQGFAPPFAVDIHERPTRDSFTVHTCKTLVEAARLASREFNRRRYMRSMANRNHRRPLPGDLSRLGRLNDSDHFRDVTKMVW